jgi:hypothetical protein
MQHDEVGQRHALSTVERRQYSFRLSLAPSSLQVFAFDRTVSRLLEMQANEYVATSLQTFPQGPAFIAHTFSYAIQKHQRPHAHSTAPLPALTPAAAAALALHHTPDDSLLQRVGLLGEDLLQTDEQLRDHAQNTSVEQATRRELQQDVERALQQLWAQYHIGSIDETDAQAQDTSSAADSAVEDRHGLMRADDCTACLTDIAEYAVRLFTHAPFTGTQDTVLAAAHGGGAGAVVRSIVTERLLAESTSSLPGQGYVTYLQYSAAAHRLLYLLVRDAKLQEHLEELPQWLPFKLQASFSAEKS